MDLLCGSFSLRCGFWKVWRIVKSCTCLLCNCLIDPEGDKREFQDWKESKTRKTDDENVTNRLKEQAAIQEASR